MKLGLLLGSILLAFLVLAMAFLFWLDDGLCGNDVIAEYPSPGNRSKVVVFQRDCGASTGFSTQASVLAASSALPDDAGNVFVADTGRGEAPSTRTGGPELWVEWVSDEQVILRHHPAVRVFHAREQRGAVRVRYETLP